MFLHWRSFCPIPPPFFSPIELYSNVFLAMPPFGKNVSVFWIYDKVYTKNLKGGEEERGGESGCCKMSTPSSPDTEENAFAFSVFFGKSISLFLCSSEHFEQPNGLLVKSIRPLSLGYREIANLFNCLLPPLESCMGPRFPIHYRMVSFSRRSCEP